MSKLDFPTTHCPIVADCQSCMLLSHQYTEQLKHKKQDFIQQLYTSSLSIHNVTQVPIKVIAAPLQNEYRHTAKLAVTSGHIQYDYSSMQQRSPSPFDLSKKMKQRLKKQTFVDTKIGLYRPKSHQVIDIKSCPMHCKPIQRVLVTLADYLPWSAITCYRESQKTGLLKHIVCRVNAQQDAVMLTLVTSHYAPQKMQKLASYMSTHCPLVTSIMNHVHTQEQNAIFDTHGSTHLIYGVDLLQEKMMGLNLRVSASSFYQVNPGVAQQAYQSIQEILKIQNTDRILDLYCGVGGITLSLAQHAQQGIAIGIEESPSSIADAQYNAMHNKNTAHAEFRQGRVEECLHQLSQEHSQFDAIVLNPSRRGCQTQVLQQLPKFNAKKIVYMSCYPPTLLRDLSRLNQSHYTIQQFMLFDMFPNTAHYEVVCELKAQ